MGNCHYVTQIKPTVHKDGAVIKVKSGKEEVFKKLYEKLKDKDNTSLTSPQATICCANINVDANNYQIPSSDLYLVLASGSKYGYGESLRNLYKKLSEYLEDGLFYITDEYALYIEQFEIKNGKLINEMVVYEDGHLIEYYEKTFPKDQEALFQLMKQEALDYADLLSDGWSETLKEAMTLVNKALKIQSFDVELLVLKGNILTYQKKYDHAIKVFEKVKHPFENQYHEPLKQIHQYGIWVKDEESQRYRQIYCSLGFVYLQKQEFEKAIEICTVADRIYPSWGDELPKEYMSYALLNLKRFQEALELNDRIISFSQKRNFIAFAFYNKACALVGLNRLDEAAGCIASAISLNEAQFSKAFKSDKDLKELLNNKSLGKIMGSAYERLFKNE